MSIADVKVCDIIVEHSYEAVEISEGEISDQIMFKLPACPGEICSGGSGVCSIKVNN